MLVEEITRDSYQEFHRRYTGTLGFLESASGKKSVVSVIESGPAYTVVLDKKGNEFRLNSDTGCKMEFTQVPSQWFEVGEGRIIYACRRPERQWRRGICSENTMLYSPRKNGQSLYHVDVSASKISQLFYPDSDSDDFSDLYKLKCGLWGKHFAWTVNSVWLKNMLIGTVDHETKTVYLATALFEQELRDALIRSNSDYQVKVK